MAHIFATPKGYDPPTFDDYFIDGNYDRALDDKLTREFFERLAAYARSVNTGEYVGEVVHFAQGDGAAVYMVWQERPLFSLVHIPIHDAWQLPEAHERGLRLSDVIPQIESERKMKAKAKTDDEWWDSQEVGTILHYHNGFGEFVRCEVVDGPWASGLSGEEHTSKHLQPIALVGEWRNLRSDGFHAKKVLNREGGWRPSTGNIYEHPDYVGSSSKGINPTDLPALEIGDSNGG